MDWDGPHLGAMPGAQARRSGPSAHKRRRGYLARAMLFTWSRMAEGAAQLAQLPEAQSVLVALDPCDGALAALVGGFDYFANKYNRVTQARRLPGSGFKPFLYSAALENGFTPSSILLDAPCRARRRGHGGRLAA